MARRRRALTPTPGLRKEPEPSGDSNADGGRSTVFESTVRDVAGWQAPESRPMLASDLHRSPQ